MAKIICVPSQEGEAEIHFAPLIAREYADAGWSVTLADLDVGQGTSFNWRARRLQHLHERVLDPWALKLKAPRMYGPPQDCKGKAAGEKTSLRQCENALSTSSDFGLTAKSPMRSGIRSVLICRHLVSKVPVMSVPKARQCFAG